MTSADASPVPATGITLTEAARITGGRVDGDGALQVHDVVPVREARPGTLGFLASRKYLERIPEGGVEALLVTEELAPAVAGAARGRVVVDDAHAALGKLIDHLHPPREVGPGIHPTAVLGRGVRLGTDVSIGPYAVLGDGVTVGHRVRIAAHVTVAEGCRLGDDVVLHPQVVLYPGSVLGNRVVLHAGVRIGVDGFGYVYREGRHQKIRHVGGCFIEDDVEVGANCCVDRGSIGSTRIGAGTKLDNLVHVAHNVSVGRHVLLIAQVGISGSTTIGDGAVFAGQSGATGHLSIGPGAQVGAKSGVINDVAPGEVVLGFPARERKEYWRAKGALYKLPELMRTVRDLGRRVEELEAAMGGSDPID